MPTDEQCEPPQKRRDELSVPLNARQIATSLLYRKGEPVILEEFLLWPPDLFAFTSHVFSITGAYNMVVSPHSEEGTVGVKWPPDEHGESDYPGGGWGKFVRQVGFEWRSKLAGFKDQNGELQPGHFDEARVEACKGVSIKRENREKEIRDLVGSIVGQGDESKWVPPIKDSWIPKEVGDRWAKLCSKMGEEDNVEDLLEDWEAFKLMMTLHAIVDEACVGWGIRDIPFLKEDGKLVPEESPSDDTDQLLESNPAKFAAKRLQNFGTIATVDKLRGRVLPKRHTPSIGITLRSLTNNLAYHRSSVDVKWVMTDPKKSNELTRRLTKDNPRKRTFSMLLLPWPRKVNTLDFKAVENHGTKLRLHNELGLFHYDPSSVERIAFEKELSDTLESAKREVGTVDMVVLPECALSREDIDSFQKVVSEHKVSAYVAGVRGAASDGVFADNMVYFKMGYGDAGKMVYQSPGGEHPDDQQHKHHRWKVERFQIENYSLGSSLSPSVRWWESIRIRPRKVTFINVGNELTICPLICEDLARQDPIADLIRTVGPSLVITILMDGPQTKERWSARYASVLSEDPGSAVITLTSAGMVDRWRRPKFNTPRYVALWNDGQGSEREIELEKDSVGVLLSLSVSGRKERSADGREESYETNRVLLGGVHQVRMG